MKAGPRWVKIRGKQLVVTHLLVYPVLVDGPDGGHVGVEQLAEGDLLLAGPGADEARLAHRVVPDQDALDELLVRLLVVHLVVVVVIVEQSLLFVLVLLPPRPRLLRHWQ